MRVTAKVIQCDENHLNNIRKTKKTNLTRFFINSVKTLYCEW